MKKRLLVFDYYHTLADVHNFLKSILGFPEHYGKNLDALHDCLMDIHEDTVIGIFEPDYDMDENIPCDDPRFDGMREWYEVMNQVFKDCEEENPHLMVIFSPLNNNDRKYSPIPKRW